VPVCCADDAAARLLATAVAPGTRLALPTLLALPRLVTLALADTHLGDVGWAQAPVRAPLQRLELGGCALESPCANTDHARALLANPALMHSRSISELTLSSPLVLADDVPAAPSPAPVALNNNINNIGNSNGNGAKPRLPALKTVNLTQQFPLARLDPEAESPLQATLSALADSPLERLEIRCYADDVDDCHEALEGLGAHGLRVCVMTVPDGLDGDDGDCDCDSDSAYGAASAEAAFAGAGAGAPLTGVVTAFGFARDVVA
jgi:hypothetical protein